MKTPHLKAYVSPTTYLEGKEESVYPRFREDLALLDPSNGYIPIAARGIVIKVEEALSIPDNERAFLEEHLPSRKTIAIDTAQGIMLVLGQLYPSCGLHLAILPHGSKGAVAYAVGCLGTRRILSSPAVSSLASREEDAEEIYQNLTELIYLCLQILEPTADPDFRLHCAHIAQLAGCRANATALPVGHFPIRSEDLQRWTAFLLCVFLTLRGDSSIGTALRLDHADTREFSMELSHESEYARKTPVSHQIYRFLSLPAFSEFRLIRSGNRFSIEARLQRSHVSKLLRAPLDDLLPMILHIDLL